MTVLLAYRGSYSSVGLSDPLLGMSLSLQCHASCVRISAYLYRLGTLDAGC